LGAQQVDRRVMITRDQHAIIVIGPFELRLQPRVVLDHQQWALFGPPTHRQLASFIPVASRRPTPASADGSRNAKQLPFPGSLVTSIAPFIACVSCSASKAPSPNPAALVETKGLNRSRSTKSRAMPRPSSITS